MKNKFTTRAYESLGKGKNKFYVYALADPRNKQIFYIGKGCGNRVFAHVNEALDSQNRESDKLDLIREIKKSGKDVLQYIIRSSLTKKSAFNLEAVLIDLLTFKDFEFNKNELSNIVSGHHSEDDEIFISQYKSSILTTDELNKFYSVEKLTNFKHKVMAININKTYKNSKVKDIHPNIYEQVRKSWRVSVDRANQAEFVFAEYKGIVRAIFKPTTKWYKSPGSKNRYEFEGERVSDKKILDLYLNKEIKRNRGNMSPVRYFGFDGEK